MVFGLRSVFRSSAVAYRGVRNVLIVGVVFLIGVVLTVGLVSTCKIPSTTSHSLDMCLELRCYVLGLGDFLSIHRGRVLEVSQA